jgi:hypothetical protein
MQHFLLSQQYALQVLMVLFILLFELHSHIIRLELKYKIFIIVIQFMAFSGSYIAICFSNRFSMAKKRWKFIIFYHSFPSDIQF